MAPDTVMPPQFWSNSACPLLEKSMKYSKNGLSISSVSSRTSERKPTWNSFAETNPFGRELRSNRDWTSKPVYLSARSNMTILVPGTYSVQSSGVLNPRSKCVTVTSNS